MPRALAPRVPKPKITLTTDFTNRTDEERPDSKSVQSVVQVFAVQVFVVEIVVVLNFVAQTFVVSEQTAAVGRTSDDHRTQNAARGHRPKLC